MSGNGETNHSAEQMQQESKKNSPRISPASSSGSLNVSDVVTSNISDQGPTTTTRRDIESIDRPLCLVTRVNSFTEPTDAKTRLKNRWSFRMASNHRNSSQQQRQQAPVQYRIRSPTIKNRIMGPIQSRLVYDPSQFIRMTTFLHWSFRTSFMALFLASFFLFLLFTLLWAVLIYYASLDRRFCIRIGGEDFSEAEGIFMDAYHLSWTTFTTVGYGAAYPTVGRPVSRRQNCVLLNMITAAEAFSGILYAAMVGSLFVGKISRAANAASAVFSDPIVIQYGRRVEDTTSQELLPEGSSQAPLACPVLEFRVINTRSDKPGGEILNVNLQAVSSVAVAVACPTIVAAANSANRRDWASKSLGFLVQHANSAANSATQLVSKHALQQLPLLAKKLPASVTHQARQATARIVDKTMEGVTGATRSLGGMLPTMAKRTTALKETPKKEEETSALQEQQETLQQQQRQQETWKQEQQKEIITSTMAQALCEHVIVDEEPSEDLVPRLVFSKLNLETDSHPYFKRVWTIRHVLNQESPLLSGTAKNRIRANHGHWPREWNTHQAIRKHVQFSQIIVSLSGTSNVSGSAVYAQKIYDYADVNIGYTFANVLCVRPRDHQLVIDSDLLNDVREQPGGGAEPFTDVAGTAAPSRRPVRLMSGTYFNV